MTVSNLFPGDPDSHAFGQELRWHTVTESAKREGLWPLCDEQWAVIRFVLKYFEQHGKPPIVVRVGRATGMRCGELFRLFPDGPIQTVFRLAGLPHPISCEGGCRR